MRPSGYLYCLALKQERDWKDIHHPKCFRHGQVSTRPLQVVSVNRSSSCIMLPMTESSCQKELTGSSCQKGLNHLVSCRARNEPALAMHYHGSDAWKWNLRDCQHAQGEGRGVGHPCKGLVPHQREVRPSKPRVSLEASARSTGVDNI
jgi:hypothetical protein